MHTETVLESNDIDKVAPSRVGDTLSHARVSTNDQNPAAQRDRLIEAGAIRIFTDIVSGNRFDRPGSGRAHRGRIVTSSSRKTARHWQATA